MTGLERAFRDWEIATARHAAGPHVLTVNVRIDSDHSAGTAFWRLTDEQEQRLIDLLNADEAALR